MTVDPHYLLAPLGIAGLVLLSWALGAFRRAKLSSPEQARERFETDFPKPQIRDVIVSENAAGALLALDRNRVGIVFPVGDKLATRLWRKGSDWYYHRDGQRMLFAPHDDSASPVVFLFATEDAADEWEGRLTPLLGPPEHLSDTAPQERTA